MVTVALAHASVAHAPPDERPVLVAIRAASSSNQSLGWAAHHARVTDAPLILVHAVPSALLLPPGTDYAGVVASGRLLLQTEAARLASRSPSLRISTYLHCGDVVHALLGLSVDAGLLVLGADRSSPFTGVFGGSLAVEVALGSLAPTLIIPAGYRENSMRNGSRRGHVVVGVDGSSEASAALLRAATEADRAGTALRVISAARPEAPLSRAQTQSISDALAIARAIHPTLVISCILEEQRTPARTLVRHGRDAMLLVIGRHGYGARPGMTLGAVTHSILLQPPCPTLVMPPSRSEAHVPTASSVLGQGEPGRGSEVP